MNKKFSTLLTVGLLTGGALFSYVDAKDVAPAAFINAIGEGNVLDLTSLELGNDKVIALTGDVDLYPAAAQQANKETPKTPSYVIIKDAGITLTSSGSVANLFKGRIVIAAEDVTVSGLKLQNNLSQAVLGGFWNNTSITIFADKATITGNELSASVNDGNTTNIVNGVILYPQSGEVAYTVKGNKFTGFAQTAFDSYGYWYSIACQVYQNAQRGESADSAPLNLDALKNKRGVASKSAVITKGLDGKSIANTNTFSSNDANVIIRNGIEVFEDGEVNTNHVVEFAYLTKAADETEAAVVSKANTITLSAFEAALADVITNGKADGSTVLTVEGATPTEIAEAIETIASKGQEADALVSKKALSEAAVLINTVDANGNATGAVALGDVAAPAGTVQVSVSETGDVVVAPIASTAKEMTSGNYYVFMDKDEPAKALGGTTSFAWAEYETSTKSNFLWTIDEMLKGDGTAAYATLKNKAGKYLASSSKKVAVKLKKDGNKYVLDYGADGKASFSTVEALGTALSASPFDKSVLVVNAPANTIVTASQLKQYYGASFEAKIEYADESLNADQFIGLLTPKTDIINATNSSYALVNADGNYIVVDTKDKYAVGNNKTYGYKLKAITSKALRTALADADTRDRYAYLFTVYAYDGFAAGDSKVARIEVAVAGATATSGKYTIGALEVEKENYLSAEKNTNDPYLSSVSIELGHFNIVDVKALLGSKPGFFTVTAKHKDKDQTIYGKVLGLDAYGNVAYVKANEALVSYPETQFAMTYDADNKVLTLKNREQPSAAKDYTRTENGMTPIYWTFDAEQIYCIPGETDVFAYQGDTIEIIAHTDYNEYDGYLRLNADELKDQSYYVGIYSPVWKGNAWMVENHAGSHQVGLDTEKANATEWTLTPAMCHELDVDGEVVSVTPDTIEIRSILGYYDGNTYKTTVEKVNGVEVGSKILKFPAYTLMNSANGEYMAYDGNSKYVTGEASKKIGYTDAADADYFALKMVGNDKYNLVTVSTNEDLVEDPVNTIANRKVYGGDSADKGILNRANNMYAQTENDIFTVEPKEAPEYRTVAMADTIKIFRNESADEAQVLFEKGEFLSIANAVQFPEINPALYVDTAYVDRAHNNRWEYLLAVDAKHWEDNRECDIEGHPKHKADTTSGRFLVNLMDSAYVYGETHLHNNKFINEEDGEDWAKLGFVEGYHTHDTLYLKRPNGTYDKLPMDRKDYSHSIAKYAFRYVDQEEGSFVIETGRKAWNGGEAVSKVETGYLKWLNGVVVVVADIKNADVFNMNEDETRTPTANDEINASEVSIVATDGAVIINGAAGKKVTISNVLGQTVANTVLSSDKAEIAAPAGVVVVAVEGEAAVKAIVK